MFIILLYPAVQFCYINSIIISYKQKKQQPIHTNMQPESNKIIANKYKIIKKLKSGGFGSVYIAQSLTQDKTKYAIKMMPKKYENYANIENQIYQQIKEKKFTLGFIKFFEHGIHEEQIYLVLQLIGLDLQEVMAKMKSKKLSIKTVLMIGLQTIDRIQALHTIGYVHRDIKPDNLAIGIKQKANLIYLFDFGLMIKNSASLLTEQKGKMIGALGFMSIRCHQGKKATYHDDIQSFAYTLVYMILGQLPWMQIHVKSVADYHRIRILKQGLTRDWFKKNQVPKQICQILEIARQGNTKQKIDYLNIKYKLIAALRNMGEQNDFNFDWIGHPSFSNQKDDSPVKRKEEKKLINQMNKSNQKNVQKQIYEVYKFIDNQQQKQPNPKNQKKGPKVVSPNKLKNQNIHKQQKKQKIKQIAKPKRPLSCKNPVNRERNQQINIMTQLQRKIKEMGKISFEGPRIVINRTAQHKI